MNITLKQKIAFSLTSGISFAILNSIVSYFVIGDDFKWWIFIFNTIFFGVFFGFSYLYLMKKSADKLMKSIQIEINTDEKIIQEGPANLFRGIEAVGGKLILTDKRLVFKSHKLNIQSGMQSIAVGSIKEVMPRKTAKFFQNGIRVTLKPDEYFDFVVYERETWMKNIEGQTQLHQG